MRVLLALAALPLLATFAPFALFSEPTPPVKARLWAAAVPLDGGAPARRRVGALTYLAGWSLRSDDRRFGGISAMHVEDGAVTALSDAGTVIAFAVPGDAGPQPVAIDPLPEGPGSSRVKGDRDSEAMVVRGRDAWIAFEGRNAVWRYDRKTWRGEASHRPPAMRKWRSNSGGEAMVRLRDGRFLIFSEGGWAGGRTEALLFAGDPALAATAAAKLDFAPPEGYRITDAALLPDGRILMLSRRVSLMEGFTAKLTLATLTRRGTLVSGGELAHFGRPLTIDNMEALSVTRERGRTILWLASDDNLNAIQRTLLLKFALTDGNGSPATKN